MSKAIRFIDLFAGIGGFHLAFEQLGATCVFASEKDPDARKTYIANFCKSSPEMFANGHFNDDILTLDPKLIPEFDILCAGFPCQPFSQAGHKLGFGENYQSRGNMFFVLRDIIAARRPKAFFLENVRNLMSHDNGRTFTIIRETLQNDLRYDFYPMIVRASDYGLPQHRARAFMIGIDRDLGISDQFKFPEKLPLKYNLSQIFGGRCDKEIGFTLRVGGRGSKFGDRRNWEFYLVDGRVVRLGIKEGKMMMGLPEDFLFPVSEVQAMKQLGNGVAIDAVAAVAKELLNFLERNNVFEQPQELKSSIRAVS